MPRAVVGRKLSVHVGLGIVALAGLAAVVEPTAPSLAWEAPGEGCPAAAEVERRLARLLGDDGSVVRAAARVEPSASGWRVELALEWRGHRDTRTLEAERCDTLADATVLLVATMVDPVAVLLRTSRAAPAPVVAAPPSPPPAVVAPPPVRTLGEPPRRPAPERRARPPRDRGLALGVSGQLDLGSLPRVAGGVAAQLGWRWPWARLYAEAVYLPSRRVLSQAPYAHQGRVQLGAGRVGACVRAWIRRVELPVCGGLEVGGTRSTGFGVGADLGASDPWLAVLGDAGVTVPLLPGLALLGRAGVAVPVVYSEYVFGDESLYRARPAALRGAIGFEFRWGPRKRGMPENPGSG